MTVVSARVFGEPSYGQASSWNMTMFALPAIWLYSSTWHVTFGPSVTTMRGEPPAAQLAVVHVVNAVARSVCMSVNVMPSFGEASSWIEYATHGLARKSGV